MGTKKNRHGLPRDIPSGVKRQIRKNSGFGCVICGKFLFHYEHVTPEFADAKGHEPDCMTLLCPDHHELVHKGEILKKDILQAMKSPKALEQGFSRKDDAFRFNTEHIEVEFCGTRFIDCEVIVGMMKTELLSVQPPVEPGKPFLITGHFFDSEGKHILSIEENEICPSSANWDVEYIKNVVTIRRGLGDIALVLKLEPPSRIVIERLDMFFKGASVSGQAGKEIEASGPSGGSLSLRIGRVHGARTGLVVEENGLAFGSKVPYEKLSERFYK